MWTSILSVLDGVLLAFNKIVTYWSEQALKESGRVEERLKAAEVTLDRQRISNEAYLEVLPHDKHLILSRL